MGGDARSQTVILAGVSCCTDSTEAIHSGFLRPSALQSWSKVNFPGCVLVGSRLRRDGTHG